MDVVVVDSGLGGLEVAARLFEQLRASRRGASIHYVNLRPPAGRRFEDPIPLAHKLRQLDELLADIERELPFDLLAMACNSLSTLLPQTRFHAAYAARVVRLDEVWIQQFCSLVDATEVFVFGTELTLRAGVYRRALLRLGVPDAAIIEQACPGLANAIQDGHAHASTLQMLEAFVGAAVRRSQQPQGRPAVVLACTHYGYLGEHFELACEAHGLLAPRVVSANLPMARAIEARLDHLYPNVPPGAPSITIHSCHALSRSEQHGFMKLIAPISSNTAAALERVRGLASTRACAPITPRLTETTMKKDFLEVTALSTEELHEFFELTARLKADNSAGRSHQHLLAGRSLAMVFQKPSLRTRVSFETGMFELGGHAVYLAPGDIGFGEREPIHDIGQVLSRYNDIIMARVYEHRDLLELAEAASVPVINGLSTYNHPCQICADIFTIWEHKRGNLENLKIVYVGEGNYIAHSWLNLSRRLPMDLTIACPAGYEPNPETVAQAQAAGVSRVRISHDLLAAVPGCDAISTEIWASSVRHRGLIEQRKRDFCNFRITREVMDAAGEQAIFLHDLPANRGLEVTGEVIDGPRSVVYDEAENRLHAQKAIMLMVLGVPYTPQARSKE